jgi:AhpD family alkylhydroperoxidase
MSLLFGMRTIDPTIPIGVSAVNVDYVHIDKQTPQVYRSMVGVATAVAKAAEDAGLSRGIVELVNVRVSQMNGCATCLDVHHRKALAAGVTEKQLSTVSVWRDTELFDEREQAALRLAEMTTSLLDRDTADREYSRARRVLGDDELSAVIWVATAINAFNRVSILSHHTVRP